MTHAIWGKVATEPEPAPIRAPLPPLRRANDHAPFEHPAFAGALAGVLDHVVDEAKRRGEPPALTYGEIEELCRTFLTHYIVLGGMRA